MYIVRSFYQLADGHWISHNSGAMSKADAEFLKDRLYFHFNSLHDEGVVNDYAFTLEEVKRYETETVTCGVR